MSATQIRAEKPPCTDEKEDGGLSSHTELARKLADLEQRIEGHDTAIRSLFDAIRQLMAPPSPEPPKPEIGFHVKEDAVPYRTKRKTTS